MTLFVSVSGTETRAIPGVGILIGLVFAAFGGGLFFGRVWAYWPSVGVLALFVFLLGMKAVQDVDLTRTVVA